MAKQTTLPKMYIRGRDLKLMRLHAKKTTAEMADLLSIKSRKTIESWENETSEPSLDKFCAYCLTCGFSPSHIIAAAFRRNEINPEQNWDINLQAARKYAGPDRQNTDWKQQTSKTPASTKQR